MAQQADPVRIIVQNLSFETTKEELAAKFAPFGVVVDTVLALDATGRSRGFGFVTFSDAESVARALDGGEAELGGRVLRVQPANARREARGEKKSGPAREVRATGPKLYCGDLPWELSAEELAAHFEKFGKVENAYLAEVQYAASVNGYKPHRGFGFVEFATEDEATAALRATHEIKGAAVRVTSAKGEAKGERRERRERPERSERPQKERASPPAGEEKKKRETREPRKEREPRKDKPAGASGAAATSGAASGASSGAATAKAPAPAAAPAAAQKQRGVKVKAAPSVNPWSKKGDEGKAEVSASDYPTLGDVASGKVKLRKKTEDEIAQEIANERAREKGAKNVVEGKGKEELE